MTLRIACLNFEVEEIEALRRVMVVLSPHVREPWALVGSGEPAEIALLNLDAVHIVPNQTAGTVVGCSTKPDQHPPGTLALPVRAYELLPLLSSRGAQAGPATPSPVIPAAIAASATGRYKLYRWPAAAMAWSPDRWKVMAATRCSHRTIAETATATGVATAIVQACFDDLVNAGAMLCVGGGTPLRAVEARPQQSWRSLAARVSQMLRLAS